MTLSKFILLCGVIVLAIVAFVAFAFDTVSIAHLLAGLALGCGLVAAAGLPA